MNNKVVKFLQECYKGYLPTIHAQISEFPSKYVYPDGNPIKPVLPVQTFQEGIMFVGAFPSARFERRNGMLIPVADNLSPFGEEAYFDGREIRIQESRESLSKHYFPQLGINVNNIWLTDLVKIYLYPQKHIKNCLRISPEISYINTHKLFHKIAAASLEWMIREIKICNPKLIITLGEIPARILDGDKTTENNRLLDGRVRTVVLDKEYKIAHLAHPEIRRLNKDWNERTKHAINILRDDIQSILS